MKRGLWLLVLLPLVAAGQGHIVWQNSSATAITNINTGQRVETNLIRVGLFVNYNTVANWLDSGWSHQATTSFAAPGIFLGGNITLNGFPAGTPIAVQTRAWDARFSTWEAGFAGPWGVGWARPAVSWPIVLTPTAAASPPPTIVASGFEPFWKHTAPIPEPSVLCLLAAVGLWIGFWRVRQASARKDRMEPCLELKADTSRTI